MRCKDRSKASNKFGIVLSRKGTPIRKPEKASQATNNTVFTPSTYSPVGVIKLSSTDRAGEHGRSVPYWPNLRFGQYEASRSDRTGFAWFEELAMHNIATDLPVRLLHQRFYRRQESYRCHLAPLPAEELDRQCHGQICSF